MMFFLRRLLLSLTLIFWASFFWGQVALQYFISTALIIVIQWARPFNSAFATKIETFNECTNMVILYILMLFSDFVGDLETRSNLGNVYIGLIIAFSSVHLWFLFSDSIKKLYLKVKAICHSRKLKKVKRTKIDKQMKTSE